jgi:hypothetical protein
MACAKPTHIQGAALNSIPIVKGQGEQDAQTKSADPSVGVCVCGIDECVQCSVLWVIKSKPPD